jgi:hydrogenase/urease accessory protein HupE
MISVFASKSIGCGLMNRFLVKLSPLLLSFIVMLVGQPALAHLMPASRGTVSIKGNNVYAVQSVPVSALTGFDKNGDRLIDQTELTQSYESLQSQLSRRIQFRAEGVSLVEAETFLVAASDSEHPGAPINYIVALTAAAYSAPPTSLSLTTDLFGTAQGEQRLELSATYGDQTELVVLTPERQTHHFFKSGFETFLAFVDTGVRHILAGMDHLLFLLAMIAVPLAARRLLLVVTGFTIAHAITISMASLGYMTVPANIVEPLIALSIVLLAADNLRADRAQNFWLRFGVVFACGLLHGLGFASALGEFGLNKAHLLPSLLGFNVGVELGQVFFVLTSLAIGWATMKGIQKTNFPLTATRGRQAISLIAIALGVLFFVQRVLPASVS